MNEAFVMPKIGHTMTEGTIRAWLVEDGATVQPGDPVVLIETDKVETEIEIRSQGILRLTGVVGATYECGAVIGYVFAPAGTRTDEWSPPPTGITADTEGAQLAFEVFNEPAESAFRPQVEPAVRAVRAVAEVPADPEPMAGASAEPEPMAEVPAEPTTYPPLAAVEASTEADASIDPETADGIASRGIGGRILASPRARRAAEAAALDLAMVAGSGPSGRIVHRDVVEMVERLEAERVEAERLEAERLEAERLEAERLEAERLEAERLEAERLEAERVEAERLEAERLEAERVEAERLEAERLEAERVEAERLEAERLEAERLEAERLEAERLEAERLEAERLEAERLEAERVEAERHEAERS